MIPSGEHKKTYGKCRTSPFSTGKSTISMDIFNSYGISRSGWWLSHPSEKYEFVNGNDDSQLNGKMFQNIPNHQLVIQIDDWIVGKYPLMIIN